MKIAYSCAGEGFGHAARMVVLSDHLEKNHRVSYFVPCNIQGFLKQKISGFSARSIPVLAFVKKGDTVNLFKTFFHNLPVILAAPFTIARLAYTLKKQRYSMVISDFEPFLAWAGKLAVLPVLQINHPGIISKYPEARIQSLLAVLGARLMEGPWDKRILISFFGGDVGPLLRKSLFKHPVKEESFLVFNLKPCYRDNIEKIMQNFPNINYKLFPNPQEDFEKALAECNGVVSSAGHQIIAEALALGKPLLVLPQQGQYEQILNARMLENLGKGKTSSLKALQEDLPKFLEDLPQMRQSKNLPKEYTLSDSTEKLLVLIDQFITARCKSRARVFTFKLNPRASSVSLKPKAGAFRI